MNAEVVKVLEKIRPILQRDGGDVELIDVNEDGVVLVRDYRVHAKVAQELL